MSDACRSAALTRLSARLSGPQPFCRRAALVRSSTCRSCVFVLPPRAGGGRGDDGSLVAVVVGVWLGWGFGLLLAGVCGFARGVTVLTPPLGVAAGAVVGTVVTDGVPPEVSTGLTVGVPLEVGDVVLPFGSATETVGTA